MILFLTAAMTISLSFFLSFVIYLRFIPYLATANRHISLSFLILSFAYFGMHLNQIDIIKSIQLLFMYLVCMMGVASFAYIINDYFDKEEDRKSNKQNIFLKIVETLKTQKKQGLVRKGYPKPRRRRKQ